MEVDLSFFEELANDEAAPQELKQQRASKFKVQAVSVR